MAAKRRISHLTTVKGGGNDSNLLETLLQQDPSRRISVLGHNRLGRPRNLRSRTGFLGSLLRPSSDKDIVERERYLVPFWTTIYYGEARTLAKYQTSEDTMHISSKTQIHFGASIAAVEDDHWCKGLFLPFSNFKELQPEILLQTGGQEPELRTAKDLGYLAGPPARFAYGPPKLSADDMASAFKMLMQVANTGLVNHADSLNVLNQDVYHFVKLEQPSLTYAVPTYRVVERYLTRDGSVYAFDTSRFTRGDAVWLPSRSDNIKAIFDRSQVATTNKEHLDMFDEYAVHGHIKLHAGEHEELGRQIAPLSTLDKIDVLPDLMLKRMKEQQLDWRDRYIVPLTDNEPSVSQVYLDILNRFRGTGFEPTPLRYPTQGHQPVYSTMRVASSSLRVTPSARPRPKINAQTLSKMEPKEKATQQAKSHLKQQSKAGSGVHSSQRQREEPKDEMPQLAGQRSTISPRPKALTSTIPHDGAGYYQTLGIELTPDLLSMDKARSTDRLCTNRFTTLAFKYHSDNGGKEADNAKFDQVLRAYRGIKTVQLRIKYHAGRG